MSLRCLGGRALPFKNSVTVQQSNLVEENRARNGLCEKVLNVNITAVVTTAIRLLRFRFSSTLLLPLQKLRL